MTNENPRGLPVADAWTDIVDTPYGLGQVYSHDPNEQPRGRYVLATDYAALLAERDELRAKLREANDALAEYANPDNWCLFEGKARLWFEPDTNTPDAYAGYELASKAQAAISAMEGRECETCKGGGTVDMTLGGYSFSDPEAICPDCDGSGEAGFRKGPL